MTLVPSNVAELDALPARDSRGLSQMPWERPAPSPVGPCYWCETPAAPQLLPEPPRYQGSAVYACPATDWAACRDRKRARDAALAAAAAKAAEQDAAPKAPAPKTTRPRAERVSQAKAKLDQAQKDESDG